MGIQGLLQFIKEASEPIHMRKYKGQVVAVDTYCWLHKGAVACAEKLAKGEPTDKYVGFCMKFVNMLLSHGIKPILVFDGCTLPSKKEVEKSRRERRQANLLKGKQLLREGKVSEARECFTRSINITHAMAHNVIKAARSQGVDCLVAPYEADAQLAYLNKAGIVQAVITEDSDLLAFGCKKVILKMDQFGNGLEVDQARLGMCKQLGDVFTEEKFRYMCILSGCDYLSSLRGIGLAKACKVLRLANNPDILKVIKKIGHYLKMNITVPEDYIKGFIRANNTFLYQLVFDPIKRKLIPLNAYEDDIDPETLSYAGRYVDDSIALQIALGNKDINTFEQIDDYNPDTAVPAQSRSHSWTDKTCQKSSNINSIWNRSYCPRLELDIVSDATKVKENPSTVGIELVISTKGLNLPRKSSIAKRPRSELSEDDLFGQYSTSFTKKIKKNSCEGDKLLNSSERFMPDLVDGNTIKKSLSTPPRTRNKFATFLQRKNEESGAVVVPGTRSRFFSNSLGSADCISKKASSQSLDETAVTDKEANVNESDCLDGKKLLDISVAHNSSEHIPDDVTVIAEESQSFKTSRFTRTISPPTSGTLRSCFSWSGSLGEFSRTPSPSPSTALQQFLRKSDSAICLPENNEPSDVSQLKSDESSDESHPLHEVDWSSQSQESMDLSPHNLNASKLSQPSSKDLDSEESDCNFKSLDNQGNQKSKLYLFHFSKKGTLLRNKVPGLYKSSSVDSLSTTKIKPLVPARVSGLSKKPSSIHKRNHHNAENKPEMQIKINELWKNFVFKKDSEKLPSCKKPDPLSPVKDNIQLTPEEEDIFNNSDCMRVQRAIFQ
ncbi:exonuclease 1 isoform X2 [Neophocaena asiaeorientalis asiaeorientalis]|uniref:Exonuclease 1 n=1 Tax=Neophocaena asiaeorientalis asiaeorientalis TaxID=1706337 RepID=A0A341B270_NEOAA|nr:exonuclease 1 isoform X2 [Neophocaena asiaeorientalis asiaeorientalis]